MPVITQPITASPRSATTGLWLLVLAGVLWGTGGLLGSLLGREAGLPPMAVAACRLGVGGLLIGGFVLATRRPLPRGRRAWARIVVIGLLAAMFQAAFFAAISFVSVSLATLLTIGASPVLVLLAEGISGRRRIGFAQLGTAGLAVVGLTLLVGVPGEGRDLATLLAGCGCALLAAGGFAAMTFIGAEPVAGLDDLAATGLAFVLGSAALAPLALLAGAGDAHFTPTAVGLLLLLGLAPTAIAYAAYFRGLRTTAAGTAALMALLEPLVGTILAILLLGDRLSPAGLVGAALLIVALALEPLSARKS
ncbi:DMT family transporter [Micromonosporaceae bacterium Da 78-11]